MELKMPREHYLVIDYFARRNGLSRSEWMRNAVALTTTSEWRKLARDDPAEHRRAMEALASGRLGSL